MVFKNKPILQGFKNLVGPVFFAMRYLQGLGDLAGFYNTLVLSILYIELTLKYISLRISEKGEKNKKKAISKMEGMPAMKMSGKTGPLIPERDIPAPDGKHSHI